MSRNLFADTSAFDGLQAGTQYVDDFMDRAQSKRAGYRAAPKIAAGDYQGAAGEFGAAGMPDQANRMRGQAEDQAAGIAEGEQAQQAAQAQAAQRAVQTLTKVAQGLKGVPAGQRQAALQRAMPIFQQMGMNPEQFASLTEEQLTDEQLDLFSGEVQKAYEQTYQNKHGIYGVTGAGKVEELKAFPQDPTVLKQGDTMLGADGKPVYTAPKTYAPKAAGSGGGGGGGHGPVVDVPLTDVKWHPKGPK